MNTVTPTRSTPRGADRPLAPAVAAPGVRRRRSVPRVVGGALLMTVCAVGGGVLGLRTDPGVDVLAVARSVTAGAQLTDADLRVVHIVADPSLHVFAASKRADVVGRTAAVPLAPGSLVTAEQLGTAADPPLGQAVIAVAVKPGRAPAALAPGAAVRILVVAGEDDGSPARQWAQAVVRAVDITDITGVTVVDLQVPEESAERIAAAATTGDVTLILWPQGG